MSQPKKEAAPDHTPPKKTAASMLNVAQAQRRWKIAVYGPTGTGKTTLGVTAPRPVILLSEAQAYESIRDAAARIGVPTPPVFLIQDITTLRRAVSALAARGGDLVSLVHAVFLDPAERAAAEAALPYTNAESVVLDSISEFFKIIQDEVDREAPPKKAEDGLPERSFRHQGVVKDRCDRLLRSLRDIPLHVVMLAAVWDRMVGESGQKERRVGPECPSAAVQNALGGVCNLVGFAQVVQVNKKGGGVEPAWGVSFVLPSHYMTKVARPLRDNESPNVARWFKRLDAGADGLDQGKRDASGDDASEPSEPSA